MIEQYGIQEIEVSVLLLGLGYALGIVTLTVWFASQIGI